MNKTRKKFERKEFEINCEGRAYRIIRNYEGMVRLDRFVKKDLVGWVWQHVLDTSWDSKAMMEAIAREIPADDQQVIRAAVLEQIVN